MEAAALTHVAMGCFPGMLHRTTLGSQRIATVSCMSGSGDLAGFQVRLGIRPLESSGASSSSSSSSSSRMACKASTAVHFTDKFDSTQQAQWQTCRHLVEELGFSSDEADDILAKSFGWSYSDYWGEEKQPTIPESESVSASVALIQSLGVDMPGLVKKFPEVMGLSEREIQYSLGTLDGTWGIAGKSLKNVLMRNPQVLGYNIDCGGDCAGECSRCWVRF